MPGLSQGERPSLQGAETVVQEDPVCLSGCPTAPFWQLGEEQLTGWILQNLWRPQKLHPRKPHPLLPPGVEVSEVGAPASLSLLTPGDFEAPPHCTPPELVRVAGGNPVCQPWHLGPVSEPLTGL